MTMLTIAAVQASYVLMDREATLDRVEELTADAAGQGAQLVVLPEAFVPGTPIWIDTRPIWDGDDGWFRMLVENAVVVPGPATDRLAAIAKAEGKTLAEVRTAVKQAATARLDAAVKAGDITKAQRDEEVAELDDELARLGDVRFGHRGPGGRGGHFGP